MQGGAFSRATDGMRDGLRELGLEERKHFVLHMRDTKGDLRSVEEAARALEEERVDLIFSIATSVSLAAKRATKRVPIVFCAGTDPVAVGLVQSFRKPGERLTGVFSWFTDLTAKRLELLKVIVPGLRRVVMFYSPENPAAKGSVNVAREAALLLKLELIERSVASVADLRAGLQALQPGDADAIFELSDAMVVSQAQLVIDAAKANRLATMFQEQESVAKGGLASYGTSWYAIGRLAATHVKRVLLGADPGTLPVEQIDKLQFVINLKTAKDLGLTIPQSVLQRADEVIR